MKIAITGHSAGIGQALSKIFESQGHEVVGLSRRNGYNIRSIPKVAGMIEPCDVFINNAQVGFAQTELLWEIWNRWQGQQKTIINISTQMTECDIAPDPKWDEYIVQKKALELAHKQCQQRREQPQMILIQPGGVATQPGQTSPEYEDVNQWAQELVDFLDELVL
jgi:short-subunit dehydrogenase involved in D-alanine esterification of teichoic acids